MSDFMQLQVTQKGTLVTADCAKCGGTLYAHEWASWNFNEERDAMQAGALVCPECGGTADPDTFADLGRKYYAGRYSAPGYMDCTEWDYDTNRRRLEKTLREHYG